MKTREEILIEVGIDWKDIKEHHYDFAMLVELAMEKYVNQTIGGLHKKIFQECP